MISRRRFLAGAAALAVARAPASVRAAERLELRAGAILPLGGPSLPLARGNRADAADGARLGLVLAEEDLGHNAALLGNRVTLRLANAAGAAAVTRAARRLIDVDGVTVLIGGFDTSEAEALGAVARESGTLFLNIGASGDALRGSGCDALTFHVEASAAMYLDALVGWFVRAGHRRWHLVHGDDDESLARLERTRSGLSRRHWGGEIVGESLVRTRAEIGTATDAIAGTRPDVVLLLDDWLAQLDFLNRYEAAGLEHPVTGFPEPQTQTRRFYALSAHAAPRAGTGFRAALWEATLDAYGARELNARHGARWGRPLEPAGWAAYQALRIALEAAQRGDASDGTAMAALLASDAVFDVHKGIGVSFRPWDHQLRQSLYLVRVGDAAGERGDDLASLDARADLVGELPAIYMPGTDPIERLDQLGDIRPRERCRGPKEEDA